MDAFVQWVTGVYARFGADGVPVECGFTRKPHRAQEANTGPLNFFEHNLDVWRQLWRAVEMGDVLVFCCDVRW